MASLLQALLRNESGGRNVANTTQGTSSGQAQGFFQITTGTWNDFGGSAYAATPLEASYEQQADIASRIPLRRWDESTLAAMKATGKPIDPSRTLGENLAANGESFAGGGGTASPSYTGAIAAPGGTAPVADDGGPAQAMADAIAMQNALRSVEARQPKSLLADTMASSVGRQTSGGGGLSPSAADQDIVTELPDFALATPEAAAPETIPPTASGAAGPETGLAELFKVKDIGMPNEIDPLTGQPRPFRSRRAYG